MTRTIYLEGEALGFAKGLLAAGKLRAEVESAAVFEPTAAAVEADARKILRRASVYSPTAEQIEDARESARLEYSARAAHALRTGDVRP